MKVFVALLLMTTAAMAGELKIICVEIKSVTGQPFFECIQPDDAVKQAQLPDEIQHPELRPIRPVLTFPIFVKPFDTPNWVPDEETKKRALKRAYELNGNSMVGPMIDVSDDPVVTGKAKSKTGK